MTGRTVDADKLIEWVKKMRHRHDLDKGGAIVWVEQSRVIDLIDWLACGEDMNAFKAARERRIRNG